MLGNVYASSKLKGLKKLVIAKETNLIPSLTIEAPHKHEEPSNNKMEKEDHNSMVLACEDDQMMEGFQASSPSNALSNGKTPIHQKDNKH